MFKAGQMNGLELLLEFLRSGNLGGLHLGLRLKTALHLLGPPDDRPATRTAIWRYGDLQIGAAADRVMFIGLYVSDSAIACPLFAVDMGPIASTKRFLTWLGRGDIAYEQVGILTYDSQVGYQTLAGVVFLSDAERIASIQLSAGSANSRLAER